MRCKEGRQREGREERGRDVKWEGGGRDVIMVGGRRVEYEVGRRSEVRRVNVRSCDCSVGYKLAVLHYFLNNIFSYCAFIIIFRVIPVR